MGNSELCRILAPSALCAYTHRNLGPITAEYHAFGPNKKNYRPKRINSLTNQLQIQDPGTDQEDSRNLLPF